MKFIRKNSLLLAAILIFSIAVGYAIVLKTNTPFLYFENKNKQKIAHYIKENISQFDEIIQKFEVWSNYDAATIYNLQAQNFKKSNAPFVLFKNDSIRYWSGSVRYSLYNLQNSLEGIHAVAIDNSQLVYYKKTIDSSTYFVGIIPLYEYYNFSNSYLKTGFAEPIAIDEGYSLVATKKSNDDQEIKYQDTTIGYLSTNTMQTYTAHWFSLLLLILFFASAYYLLFVLFRLLFAHQLNYVSLIIAFIIGLVLFNNCHHFKYLYQLNTLTFFDPIFYATATFSSIGDLLIITTFLLFLSYLLLYFNYQPKQKTTHFFLITVLSALQSLGIFYLLITLSGIILNSNFSLQFQTANDYDFNLLIVYLTIMLLCSALFFFNSYIFKLYAKSKINDIAYWSFQLFWFISLTVLLQQSWLTGTCAFIWFFLTRLFTLKLIQKKSSNYTFKSMLQHIFLFSFMVFLVVQISNDIKRERVLSNLAEKSNDDDNLILDYYLNNTLKELEQDTVLSYYLNQTSLSNYKDYTNEIKRKYISSYLNVFDINIHLISSTNQLIETTNKQLFEQLKIDSTKPVVDTSYIVKTKITTASNYLLLKKYKNSYAKVVVEVQAKKENVNSFYPELLIDERYTINKKTYSHSSAYYENNQLITCNGEYMYNFEFSWVIDSTSLPTLKNIYTDTHEHILSLNKTNVSVITFERNTPYELVSRLSLWFLLFFIFVSMFYAFDVGLKILSGSTSYYHKYFAHFSNKIQLSLLFLFVLAFVIITYVSVQFYLNQNTKRQLTNLTERSKSATNILKDRIYTLSYDTLDHASLLYLLKDSIQQIVLLTSKEMSVDISLFDTHGELTVASQNDVYNDGILSSKINYVAYNAIIHQKKSIFINREIIGKLSYLSIYLPLINYKNQLVGIVNIPYFDEKKQARDVLSSFLISLFNVYIVILLLGIIITYLISQNLTNSLRTISNQFKKIRLQSTNTKLVWQANDEIGNLVSAYNKMVDQLEESARKLAGNEREKAWSEMAKQVAHEIKNPLTPMKLNMQYLQKAIKDNHPNVLELANRFSKNLIEQIDMLSTIASQFSQFAQMPEACPELVNIIEATQQIAEMYNNENCSVTMQHDEATPVVLLIDKMHFNRIITNIIKNGIQAIEDNKQGNIVIKISKNKTSIEISIEDNGAGIEEALHDKIFLPHFSTKSTGMGIGLSMVKSMVENAEGTIHFNSYINYGTLFILTFPNSTTKKELL